MENTDTNSSSNAKKMNPMLIVVGVIVLLVVAGGAFMMMNKKTVNEEATESTEEQVQESGTQTLPTDQQGSSLTPSTEGADAMMAKQEFTVEGGNFFFKPNVLKVKKGEPVTIIFKNTEGFHDFVIDEIAGAKTQRIQTGTSETITFTPDKAGSFEFYCSVGSHRQMGMKGTLTVE